MTLRELFSYLEYTKPHVYPDETLLLWLNELEGRIQLDIFLLAPSETVAYSLPEDEGTELLVGLPHTPIYRHYMAAMIDLENGDYKKYQNRMELFNAAWNEFACWFAETQGAEGDGVSYGFYLSAYGIAVKHGYAGSEEEWLLTLKGDPGKDFTYEDFTEEQLRALKDGVVQDAIDEANAAAERAKTSSEDASQAMLRAQESSMSANLSASGAQGAAQAAQEAYAAAANSAQGAGTSAEAAGLNASQAEKSAAAAAQSAQEAADNAAVAWRHQDAAAGSATDAEASAVRAEEAAQRAENAGGGGGGGGGEPGKDGVSPTVDVTAITGGHRVTITDVNGTESFDVLDGAKGEPGRTPVKGTDYWTAADRQSMVNDVLAAMPAAEGAAIIDVTALPTENINEEMFYRLLTGSLVLNRHMLNQYTVYCVDTLPETGEPASNIDQTHGNVYYSVADGEAYGYVDDILSAGLGVPKGWYPAGTLLGALGYGYKGVITDIMEDPADFDFRLLLEYVVYDCKDGKWASHKKIGWAGTGINAEIFNHPANTASGENSHAEGYETTASGDYSHAEGVSTTASGSGAHAEGSGTTASGTGAHAEGSGTTASGKDSHAEGLRTIAASDYQHVQGLSNVEDPDGVYAHIVGNGGTMSDRSNAHTVDWQGNAWFAGEVYVGSTGGKNRDDGSKKLASEEYVDNRVPKTTADDNGKVLGVEGGAWAAVAPSGVAVHKKTLTVEGWGGYNSYYKTYEQTVTVDGVTTNPRQAVFKDVELDVYDYDGNAVILTAWNGTNGGGPNNCPVEQFEGSLKFYCKDKPTVNIPLLIAVATPPVVTGAVFEFQVYHTYKNDYEGETVTYQAREGMTWAEWCASEYNPGEFEDNGYGNIYDAGYNCVYYDLEDWEVADRNDVIEARTYYAESDGS